MTRQRNREEFAQQDLRQRHGTDRSVPLSPQQSFEEELARQHLAVARDANEIARSASHAASDAAAGARSQAHTAWAALAIAMIALVVSIVTPEKIAGYLSSKPWVSWFSE